MAYGMGDRTDRRSEPYKNPLMPSELFYLLHENGKATVCGQFRIIDEEQFIAQPNYTYQVAVYCQGLEDPDNQIATGIGCGETRVLATELAFADLVDQARQCGMKLSKVVFPKGKRHSPRVCDRLERKCKFVCASNCARVSYGDVFENDKGRNELEIYHRSTKFTGHGIHNDAAIAKYKAAYYAYNGLFRTEFPSNPLHKSETLLDLDWYSCGWIKFDCFETLHLNMRYRDLPSNLDVFLTQLAVALLYSEPDRKPPKRDNGLTDVKAEGGTLAKDHQGPGCSRNLFPTTSAASTSVADACTVTTCTASPTPTTTTVTSFSSESPATSVGSVSATVSMAPITTTVTCLAGESPATCVGAVSTASTAPITTTVTCLAVESPATSLGDVSTASMASIITTETLFGIGSPSPSSCAVSTALKTSIMTPIPSSQTVSTDISPEIAQQFVNLTLSADEYFKIATDDQIAVIKMEAVYAGAKKKIGDAVLKAEDIKAALATLKVKAAESTRVAAEHLVLAGVRSIADTRNQRSSEAQPSGRRRPATDETKQCVSPPKKHTNSSNNESDT